MWEQSIANCIEDESKRFYLKNIPLWLIGSAAYEMNWKYQRDFIINSMN